MLKKIWKKVLKIYERIIGRYVVNFSSKFMKIFKNYIKKVAETFWGECMKKFKTGGILIVGRGAGDRLMNK